MTEQKALPFTGERFTPECDGGIWYEHWHRYVFAAPFASGKRVLDAACGEGYGSAFLAQSAASVIGVDISADAVDHARARYGEIGNLAFLAGSVASIGVEAKSIDLIVSFETIEHLAEQAEMLLEFRRILRPGGLLILSSPNRPVYSDEYRYRNEYHVREMDREELATLTSGIFPRSRWYGQRLLFHSVIWSQEESRPTKPAQLFSFEDGKATSPAEPSAAMYFLLICGDEQASLPDPVALSLFADPAQSVSREYAFLKRQQWQLKDEALQLKAALARLESSAACVGEEHRQIHLALADKGEELAAAAVRIDALHADLARGDTAMKEINARLSFRETWAGWLRFPFVRIKRWLPHARKDV